MWSHVWWGVALAVSVGACLTVPHVTPVDASLPTAGAAVVTVAWLARRSDGSAAILCGVPLLVAAAIVFPADQQRLLAYGVIAASAYCGAILLAGELGFAATAGFVTAGLALLRWIGRDTIEPFREAAVLAGALLVAAVMTRRSALSVFVAVATGLLTPAIPTRSFVLPLAVAAIAWALRFRLTFAPLLLLFVIVMLFPWSGVVARATPWFLRKAVPRERLTLAYAIPAGRTMEIELPPGTRSLVLSAANSLRLPPGTPVARIDGRLVRMGDIADWGATRRWMWWNAGVTVPAVPLGSIRGWGYDAWVDGAARFDIPPRQRIRVAVEPSLPPDAALQVEAFER